MGRGRATGVARGVTIGVAEGVAVGVGVGDGAPPFAVQRILPPSPTAMPLNTSLARETSLRSAEVPLVWFVHVFPASVLCEIRPPKPTANPLVGCGKSIPWIA